MDVERVYRLVSKRVVGRRRELRVVLAALATGKPLLLFGLPGVSKTTILKEVAAALSADGQAQLYTVTGDEQLTAFSLVGSFDPALVLRDGFKPEYFTPGPLVQAMERGGILYLEEVNRAPSAVLNVLMTCLSDGYLDVPRYGRVYARPGFTVVGACNPLDDVGTSRLSRGLADRFVTLELDYQPRPEELEIVRRRTSGALAGVIPFAVDVARASRSHPELRYGASVRGPIDFIHLLEGVGFENLDRETFFSLGCSAYAGKVRVKPTTARTACEIIVELMTALLERDYGGDLERLRRAPSPWGEPQEPGEEEPAGAEQGADRQGGRRVGKRPAAPPEEVPGLAKAGGSGEAGRSRAIPMVERDQRLPPSPPQAGELAAERAAALAEVAEVRRWAAHLVLRKAGEVWDGPGERSDRALLSEPWWRAVGGELDLDRTLDGYLHSGGRPTAEELRLLARGRETRQYLILVDHSGSMAGRKLLLAAVLAAVLAQLSAQGRGDYGVLAFDDQLSQIKALGEERDVEQVIETILRLPEGRATDLARAFLKAAEVVGDTAATDCILISDCMPTRGDTSFEGLRRLAQRLPSLYVAYVEERGAAIALFGQSGAGQRFDLYEWWARRWVGEERVLAVRELSDAAALVDRLSGLGPGDRL
jgi:MoxR-like ATPase